MSSRFKFTATPLSGLMLVERQCTSDNRGFFSRFFCSEEFAGIGFTLPVAQINHTLTSHKGAVRGLHFQRPPYAEEKIVSCVCGEVFDVAVDLRIGSPTYLRWHAVTLSADNHCSLMIPQGFAHGFQALTTDCELIYLHSMHYSASSEDALNIKDPSIGISWPLPLTEISARDANHRHIDSTFTGIKV